MTKNIDNATANNTENADKQITKIHTHKKRKRKKERITDNSITVSLMKRMEWERILVVIKYITI